MRNRSTFIVGFYQCLLIVFAAVLFAGCGVTDQGSTTAAVPPPPPAVDGEGESRATVAAEPTLPTTDQAAAPSDASNVAANEATAAGEAPPENQPAGDQVVGEPAPVDVRNVAAQADDNKKRKGKLERPYPGHHGP